MQMKMSETIFMGIKEVAPDKGVFHILGPDKKICSIF
jgi:hypothetical protein